MKHFTTLVGLAGVAGLLIWGAELSAEGEKKSDGKVAKRTTMTIDVKVKDNAFDPLKQEIKVGQAIKWINIGDDKHTATSLMLAGEGNKFHTGDIYPGQYAIINFNEPGTYEYECIHHPMKGKIVVKWQMIRHETLVYLTKSDVDFYELYAVEKKVWF